jgi:lipopolysaccharide transport system permease protein
MGLVYWNLFSAALTNASSSMVDSAGMIQKIYFPRLILPLSAILTPLIDFLISFFVLLGVMAWFRFLPNWHGLVLLPLLMGTTVLAVLGLGLWFCSLNVKYRDVRFVLPFFIQLLMFLTPVIYPVSIIPAKFQWIAYLNPMTGVITAARSSLIGNASVDWALLSISLAVSLVLALGGLWYFRKTEQFFADII